MNYLNKIIHGNLFEDNFSSGLTLAWEVSPNLPGMIIKENVDNIELKHTDDKNYLLMDIPDGDFVFSAKINHEPVLISDIAGVVIFSNADNYIELQSYDNNNGRNFDIIKVTKKDNKYLFYARGQEDKRWIYIGGSNLMDVSKIGFFIKGTPLTETDNLTIEKVYLCKDNIIAFDNIPKNYIIEICDSENNIVSAAKKLNDGRVFLNSKVLDMPLIDHKIKLRNEYKNLVFEEYKERIDGGDIYNRELNFKFFINGEEISTDDVLDLGQLDSYKQIMDFEIQNLLDIKEVDKTISISPVSNLYKGDEIVFLSMVDEEGEPIEFKKELTIEEINPSELVKLKLKIDRTDYTRDIFYKNDLKAKIVID